MVDVQRRQVLLSLAKGAASSSGTRSPHMYQSKSDVVNALSDVTTDASDASFFSALASPSPATSTASSSATSTSSVASPYAFAHTSLLDDDNLFAAYAGEPPQHELDGAAAWDLYYGAPTPVTPSTVTATMPVPTTAPTSVTVTLGRGAQPRSVPTATSSAPRGRQGVKRPLSQQPQPQQQQQPLASPPPTLSVSVASSMLQMRNTAEPATKARAAASKPTTSRRTKKDDTTAAIAMAAAEDSSSSSSDPPPAKKMKVSRERQLKINAASRRCRKKQKLELQFLRTHVVELQAALKDQVGVLKTTRGQQQKCAQLATFLEESIRQVEDMSSGGRPGTPKTSLFSESELMQLKATATQALAEAHDDDKSDEEEDEERVPKVETPEPCTVRAMDPTTGYYALSADRIKSLLHIASFMRNNISLESQSFSPEVISCLPIEMDGWQLRLAITEKNYTIHNCKFFPCNVQDLYDFCWATNVANKTSIKQGKNDYCVVTPLANDVAHVYSKTIGKWSLSVHGVANVSYNSLVCRTVNPETGRAMICQQSVLEDRDFEDESTIPWLFKRWVVFQPRVVDGVAGTFVEAYRTASYATGRRIYKEDNTYDSFCEHLIRRYAESNALLERMMARDPRFQHVTAIHHNLALGDAAAAACDPEETTSDRMVKDLLLF